MKKRWGTSLFHSACKNRLATYIDFAKVESESPWKKLTPVSAHGMGNNPSIYILEKDGNS